VVNDQPRQSLMERTVEGIRRYLSENNLRPGDRLPTERRLAEMFGVSRTVVRDAIKTLSGLGIVDVKDRIGLFVSEMGSESLAHRLSNHVRLNHAAVESLLQVRQTLETATAEWAAETCTYDDRLRLRALVEENRACLGNPALIPRFKALDGEIHLAIAEIAGNPIVLNLLREVLKYLRVFGEFVERVPAFVDSCTEEHAVLIDAICQKNPPAARKAMSNHLTSVYSHLLSHAEPTGARTAGQE
jgi:GntR family transcriptional regulator, transcriptional repressor for pyruvate dehydrogenase complex